MPQVILGIESTAHTFGVGVVRNGKVLSNCKRVFTTSDGEGGMIPSEVAKFHFNNKNEIYFEALDSANIKEEEIDAIAFSQGPGLAPSLLEGMRFAKELARKLARIDCSQSVSLDCSPKKSLMEKNSSMSCATDNYNSLLIDSKISQAQRGKFYSQKKIPLIPVNHCIAHLEIGQCRSAYPKLRNKGAKLTGARDPVMLYASGANTQIIAYASGKYRIFGETLDLGVGNFIDTFGRYAGLGFPAGPKIQELASESNHYIELPYKVKGMDIALSGILTNLRQKLEKIDCFSPTQLATSHEQLMINNTLYHKVTRPPKEKVINEKNIFSDEKSLMKKVSKSNDKLSTLIRNNLGVNNISAESREEHRLGANKKSERSEVNYTLSDLAYSLQETVFAMLVETAERALAHTGKKELLLGGGVACNTRLQEMCRIMCKERGAKFFCPENQFLVDNGAMIAYLGEIIFSSLSLSHLTHAHTQNQERQKVSCKRSPTQGKGKEIKSKLIYYPKELNKLDIHPRERTDDVAVYWR